MSSHCSINFPDTKNYFIFIPELPALLLGTYKPKTASRCHTALHNVTASDALVTGVLHVLRILGSVPVLYVL